MTDEAIVAEIFARVEAEGLLQISRYSVEKAMSTALKEGLITSEEKALSHHHLKEYLDGHLHLPALFAHHGGHLTHRATRELLQDWSNRPNFKKPVKKQRTVQETFDLLIERGFYGEESWIARVSEYMCISLMLAERGEVITSLERQEAEDEIDEYLDTSGCGDLEGALALSELPDSFSARKAIYQNWANRPRLTADLGEDQ